MTRGRPQASCLRQVESYLKDTGMTGLASARHEFVVRQLFPRILLLAT